MGTPGGVGETTQTYLRTGDVVEASVKVLGRSIYVVQ
jgi:2-keto-4-pentenoate hydratase/2-oxohepta-3-ene-1,7-dioic acid hydratase in catechol pathway